MEATLTTASEVTRYMSHVDAILTIMRRHAHLTDRQISERTGIEPVQQVNAICRRIADQGVVD